VFKDFTADEKQRTCVACYVHGCGLDNNKET